MKRIFYISILILFATSGFSEAQLKKNTAKRTDYVGVVTMSDTQSLELFTNIMQTRAIQSFLVLDTELNLIPSSGLELKKIGLSLPQPIRYIGGSSVTPNGAPRYRPGWLGRLLFDHDRVLLDN